MKTLTQDFIDIMNTTLITDMKSLDDGLHINTNLDVMELDYHLFKITGYRGWLTVRFDSDGIFEDAYYREFPDEGDRWTKEYYDMEQIYKDRTTNK